ncbi:MAG TPA: type II secretion system F family protein [Pirellulales bacterium]|nr:type II secretion system F family protein [Pirellulales bacterium]
MPALPLIAAIIVSVVALYLAARRSSTFRLLLQMAVAVVLSMTTLLALTLLGGFPLLAWSVQSRDEKQFWHWLGDNGFSVSTVWFGVGALGIALVVQLQRTQRQATLDVLTLAVEKRMPLPEVIRALAADQWGHGQLLGLAENLERGATLSAALQADQNLLPREALVAAKMGEATGDLAGALRQVNAGDTLRSPLRRALLGHVFYLVSLAFFAPAAFGFAASYIIPNFISIFDDFGVDLPNLTVQTIRFVYAFSWIGYCMPIVGAAVLIYLILWYADYWPLPTLGWGRRFRRGHVLRVLALATEGRRPMGDTLAGLAQTYPQPETARHLQACADETRAGANWTISLLKHGLIGVQDASLVESAQRLGNLPWALNEAADGNDRRLIYRLEAALNVLSPLVMLVWGGVIFIFMAACFLPLVKLISSLSQ